MVVNSPNLSQIFQLPPEHHHPKMTALIVVICLCVAFIGYYVYYMNTAVIVEPISPPRVLSSEEKINILSQLSSGNTNVVSEKDKMKILQSLSSSTVRSVSASLSEQQKLDILKSLQK